MTDKVDGTTIATASVHEPVAFAYAPEAEERAALADGLDIRGVKKLRFEGRILPENARDLVLEATLGATVVQDCVVTGDPVTTRVDEPVVRRYLADLEEPTGDEVEMPEDETADPLPAQIDLAGVMAEALALALPPWPRAEGAEPVDITVTEPGKTPMTDDDAKPFAALKSLTQAPKNNDGEKG